MQGVCVCVCVYLHVWGWTAKDPGFKYKLMFYFPWQQSFDIGWKVEKTFMCQQVYGIDFYQYFL